MSRLSRWIPAAGWIRSYRARFLVGDLTGGLAVGAMLIPQGLAFAQVAGVPAVAGLWSGIAAMIAYAVFGPSRQLIVGPEAGTAMMVAAVLTSVGLLGPEERLGGAARVALMVGGVFVLAAVFRLGDVADFLSRPILVGYIHGIGILLITSQLPTVLGITSGERDFIPQVLEVAGALGGVHAPTLWLSLASLALLLAFRRFLPRFPGAVLVLIAGILLSPWLGFASRGIEVLGTIERGLPTFGFGNLPWSRAPAFIPGALSIALLVYVSSALSSRVFADKNQDPFHPNGELRGLAASSFSSALVQGIPVAGSDTRTVINDASGSKTQAAGLFAAVAVAAILFFLAPAMGLLPRALLSAVVIASATSLFDLSGFARIFRVRREEGLLAVATLIGVLMLGILPGVLVAVGDLVRRAARPHDAILGRREGRAGYRDIEGRPESETLPGLIIYRMDAPLFFANARFLREQIRKLVLTAEDPVRMVVLDCGAMFDLDVTGAEILEELDREFDRRKIALALAEPHAPMRRILARTGLLQKIGEEKIFPTVGVAIRAYRERVAAESGEDPDWERVDAPEQPLH